MVLCLPPFLFFILRIPATIWRSRRVVIKRKRFCSNYVAVYIFALPARFCRHLFYSFFFAFKRKPRRYETTRQNTFTARGGEGYGGTGGRRYGTFSKNRQKSLGRYFCSTFSCSICVQVLDVRGLEEPHVGVVGPDGQEGVDVERHPQPAAQGHEHHLKVDVVAEDQPKAERSLDSN